MYILIKNAVCPTLKSDIDELIKTKVVKTWKFVVEEGKRRLMHIGDEQYKDVVLRFINTYIDGEKYYRIEPHPAAGCSDKEMAMSHFGIVLGRFSELLNTHFPSIEHYETYLK